MATKLQYTDAASMCVIRITNVHFDAGKKDIDTLFAGYNIVDQIRAKNPRTRRDNVVYVLFADAAERNRACREKHNHIVLTRAIKIQPAPTGNYEREYYYDITA